MLCCTSPEHCAPDGAQLVLGLRAINISLLRSETQAPSVANYSHRKASIGSTFVARNAGM